MAEASSTAAAWSDKLAAVQPSPFDDNKTQSAPDHWHGMTTRYNCRDSDAIDLTVDKDLGQSRLVSQELAQPLADLESRVRHPTCVFGVQSASHCMTDHHRYPSWFTGTSDCIDIGSPSDDESACGPVHHTDTTVTSHVGLHVMLKRIEKNHEFHTRIVNRVYRESNSLQDTDEILHTMREAVWERGDHEIQHRSKRREEL